MILNTLHLRAFRAHTDSHLQFSPKINLIYGANGAGKTNILEAIHCLCLSKSFLVSKDTYILRKGAPFYEVEGAFSGEHRPRLLVRLAYWPEEGKRIFINKNPLPRLADVVGQLPVVVFSPLDYALTAEGPDLRRRFINNILSQAKPVYLDDLLKYQWALKQRNALLMQARRTRQLLEGNLASWNAELITLGSRIIARRHAFTTAFSGFLDAAYEQMEQVGERPTATYSTIASLADTPELPAIEAAFAEALDRVAQRERERGSTLVGPHRDEWVFKLNDFEVRRYASQGQHRTFGMALKLAQYFYLKEHLDETPLLLLDDIFGGLDQRRSEIFLNLLQSEVVAQSFITATEQAFFDPFVDFNQSDHQALNIAAGAVIEPGVAEE